MTQNTINTANFFEQIVTASTIATTNCVTNIPLDNTIPQNTEGTEVLTVTITPKYSTSKLLIEFHAQCVIVTQNEYQIALFQDSTVNALAAWHNRSGSSSIRTGQIAYVMTSGTTSATTFKIRLANVTSGSVQMNVNLAATRLMGGVSYAWLTVKEFS